MRVIMAGLSGGPSEVPALQNGAFSVAALNWPNVSDEVADPHAGWNAETHKYTVPAALAGKTLLVSANLTADAEIEAFIGSSRGNDGPGEAVELVRGTCVRTGRVLTNVAEGDTIELCARPIGSSAANLLGDDIETGTWRCLLVIVAL